MDQEAKRFRDLAIAGVALVSGCCLGLSLRDPADAEVLHHENRILRKQNADLRQQVEELLEQVP